MNAISLSSTVSISISDPRKDPIAKYFSISTSIRTVSGPGPGLQVECSLCIQADLCSWETEPLTTLHEGVSPNDAVYDHHSSCSAANTVEKKISTLKISLFGSQLIKMNKELLKLYKKTHWQLIK